MIVFPHGAVRGGIQSLRRREEEAEEEECEKQEKQEPLVADTALFTSTRTII